MSDATQSTSSTSIAREAQLAPVVFALVILCLFLAVGFLTATALQLTPTGTALSWLAWALATIGTGMPVASNFAYWLAHHKTTVGMVAPAVVSLIPATAVTLAHAHAPMVIWLILWGILGMAAVIFVMHVVGFLLLRSAYASASTPDLDAVVIVLGGSIQEGAPSITLAQRLQQASALWHDEHERILVLTGGPVPDDSRCESDYMRDYLVARGVREESLVLERRARNTAQNIGYTLALLNELGIDRQLCVLTSDYHLYRALREGRRHGIDLIPIVSRTPPTSRLQQWCREVLVTFLAPA